MSFDNEFFEELEVTDFTTEGGAVARHEGRVIFLDKGLPGERLSARVTGKKKNILFAERVESLSPSPSAEPAWCPHFGVCGGCLWQDYAPESLRQWKESRVREALRRIGGFADTAVAPVLASPSNRGYRTKMTFAFAESPEGPVLGLRRRASKEICAVEECGIAPSSVMRLLRHARRLVAESGLSAKSEEGGFLRFLVIHAPAALREGAPQLLTECITSPDTSPERTDFAKVRTLGKKLLREAGATGFVHSVRFKSDDVSEGEKVQFSLGDIDYTESFSNLDLIFPHNSFVQTNTGAASLLYAKAVELSGLTGAERVWDVYCGAGAVGLFAADRAAQVLGFDLNKAAVEAARANAKRLSAAHCRWYSGSLAESFGKAADLPPDVVFVDPPRAGMEEKVVSMLNALAPKRIVYISCDPGTLARDLARLGAGRVLTAVQPVDMFPHSSHVETIAVLETL